MTREWYVAPFSTGRGCWIPESASGVWSEDAQGLSDQDMRAIRGPFPSCAVAVEVARKWRQVEGKRSPIYLLLVVDHRLKHCNLYDRRAGRFNKREE